MTKKIHFQDMVSFRSIENDPLKLKHMMRQENHENAFENKGMSQRFYDDLHMVD